jgi:hypothetical protein
LAAFLDPTTYKYLCKKDLDEVEKQLKIIYPMQGRKKAVKSNSDINIKPSKVEQVYMIDNFANEMGNLNY